MLEVYVKEFFNRICVPLVDCQSLYNILFVIQEFNDRIGAANIFYSQALVPLGAVTLDECLHLRVRA